MNSIIKLSIFAMVLCCSNIASGQIDSKDLCIGKAQDLDCPSTNNTVCGCDGVTYANECLGREKGVQAFTKGACGSKGKQVREDCIGEISREGCTDPPNPVCGCDGVTYENECRARVAGVKKTTKGPCGGSKGGGTDANTNPGKGNPTGNDCIDEAKRKAGIGIACAGLIEQVCGCDGVTYTNECFAVNAGVKRFTKGPCKGDNGTGVTAPNDPCIDFVKRNATTKVACSAPLDPVCGCDGVDYANPCQADNAGVKKFTKGKCKNKGGGTGNPGKGTGDPGKGGNASGCGAIYQHISPESYDRREMPACKITIDMHPCDNGAQTIADPVNNPRRVLLANEKLVTPETKCEDISFFCVPTQLQVAQDSSAATDLVLLEDAYVKVNEQGSFEVLTKKGRFLTGGVFGSPNAKGEVWATCNYKKKNYCMRMTWQKGQVDLRNNFTKK